MTKRRVTTVSKSYFTRTVNALRREMAAIRSEAAKRATSAYAQGYEDGNDEPPITDSAGRPMGRGYRTARVTIRDESGTSQEAAIQRSYRQWATNPLAKSISDIRTDYVWSDGPTIVCDNPDVEAVIDAHWLDSVNDWDGKGAQRVRDLGLYGEAVIEAFVRYDGVIGDGRVRLGAVDPSEIDEFITDAENREQVIAIRLKNIGGDTGRAGRLLKVITKDDAGKRLVGIQRDTKPVNRLYSAGELIGGGWRTVESNNTLLEYDPIDHSIESTVRVTETCRGKAWKVSATRGRLIASEVGMVQDLDYDGQCFYFAVNRTTIGMRGRPDGLAEIDWLDRYDQMFFDILEHAALLKDIVWDLLVNGGDKPKIESEVRNFVSMTSRSGKVWGHNEGVTLTAQNPDLKGADWASLSDTILNLISGGARLPVYMLGSGGDANLATATAQGSPTFKGFETRQGIVRRMLITILQYVIDCAVEAKTLPEKVQRIGEDGQPATITRINAQGEAIKEPDMILARDAFDVIMPEISPKDATANAAILSQLVTAAVAAYGMKLIPRKTAVEFIARGAEALGIELDVDAILEALDNEAMPESAPMSDLLGGFGATTEPQPDATAQPQQLDRQFTGIQIQAINAITTAVNAGDMTEEQAVNQLTVLFGLSDEEAKRLLGIGGAPNPKTQSATGAQSDGLKKLLSFANAGAATEPKGDGAQ